jgi:DNA-binding response OmpR family regulator
MMKRSKQILIIEDDPHIVDLLTLHLEEMGFTVDHTGNGTEGLKMVRDETYALIILDLMLPGTDGLTICKKIREGNRYIPILMLTAKSEELDKIMGLELGADDYITKPFSTKELIARINAILRRVDELHTQYAERGNNRVLDFGAITIDVEKRQVLRSGVPVELTNKEFDLFLLLAENPGKAFNRQELLSGVWGYRYEGYGHTVNSHINRLRNKLEEDPANPQYIRTLWGYGYQFIMPVE